MVAEASESEIREVPRRGALMSGLSRATLIAVTMSMSACRTWHTVPLSPNDSGPLPRQSRIVLVGGERVLLEGGRTTGDTLIGARPGGARFAVPRDSVHLVQERKVSAGRSIAAGVGGLAILAYWALLYVASHL
jgi:hypothetical protein